MQRSCIESRRDSQVCSGRDGPGTKHTVASHSLQEAGGPATHTFLLGERPKSEIIVLFKRLTGAGGRNYSFLMK